MTERETQYIDFSIPSKDELPKTAHELQENDFKYEVLVVGMGLTECTASTLLTINHKNILHIDENDFYGRNNASISLTDLAAKCNVEPRMQINQPSYRHEWHIDTIPKLLMARGREIDLIKALSMEDYFNFRSIKGLVAHNNKIQALPLSVTGAVSSGLIGFTSVIKFNSFLRKILAYKEDDTSTHFFNQTDSTKSVLKENGFASNLQTMWVNYVFALNSSEKKLFEPPNETIANVQRYMQSLNFMAAIDKGNELSPFLYLDYGSGSLVEGYARKAGVYGSTYRLKCELQEILYDDQGLVRGATFFDNMITNAPVTIECKAIIIDPEIRPEMCEIIGTMIRCVVITRNPLPNTNGKSCQVIIPPDQKNGKTNVTYMCMLTRENSVCPENFYITVISTKKDFNDDPTHDRDIKAGLELFGESVQNKFILTNHLYRPKPEFAKKGIFVSNGIDPATHFQNEIKNAFEIKTKVMEYLKQNP